MGRVIKAEMPLPRTENGKNFTCRRVVIVAADSRLIGQFRSTVRPGSWSSAHSRRVSARPEARTWCALWGRSHGQSPGATGGGLRIAPGRRRAHARPSGLRQRLDAGERPPRSRGPGDRGCGGRGGIRCHGHPVHVAYVHLGGVP